MEQAHIFNIQKFSLNDGPGIRTTIFFQGCPLRCKWCSNPESQSVSNDACLQTQKAHHCDTLSVQEVFDIVMSDKAFYEESKGGVTFSGGEALLYPKFILKLSALLAQEHISTCIETTAYANPATFRSVIAMIDHIIIDVKHYDSDRHLQGTKKPLELIEDNTAWALAHKDDVLLRIPIIPGFNDRLEDADGFAQKLKRLQATKVQLLPFHQFGEKKYEDLGLTYAFKSVPSLHKEDLVPYCTRLKQAGIECFIEG